jgi:putative SOS response-associated peptidase YedK
MEPIHDRMPVIVALEDWESWLSAPVEDIQGLVKPYPPEPMQVWSVDRRVSKVGEDDAALMRASPETGETLNGFPGSTACDDGRQ